jgi:hypothetical protein
MTATTHEQGVLLVTGRGEAVASKRDRFDAPALAAIRYADPAAWITATAVANAIEPARAAIAAEGDRVGIIVTSPDGPVEAIAAITEAARGGFSSPIRYPASNPGSLAGLASIAFGFRGPTLVITLPLARGVPVGLLLAEAWLARQLASYVAVATCVQREADGKGAHPAARCLLLARPGAAAAGPPLDRARETAWLEALPEGISNPSDPGGGAR